VVPGAACPVGRNTKSYYKITKCKVGGRIPARSDGAVSRLGDDFAGLLANARGGHPEDDYMSLSVFVTRECGSAALLTRAAAIVAKGKRVRMQGGLRRFSRACALAQACRCEVRT